MSKGKQGFLFLLPSLAWIVAFMIYPLVYTLRMSFYSTAALTGIQFVGLDNYYRLFSDARFWSDVRVTVIYVVTTTVLEVLLGLALALLVSQEIRGKRFFRVLYILPLFACPVAVSYIGLIIFNEEGGVVNAILQSLGMSRMPWLSNSLLALASCILLDIWEWTPFTFLLITAGIQGLPGDIYEAAKVDGASGWQMFRYLTMPLLKPILITTTLFKGVYSLKVFDIPMSLTGGGPGTSTEVLSIYIYRTALKFLDDGYACAMSIVFLLVTLLISIGVVNRVRRIYVMEGTS